MAGYLIGGRLVAGGGLDAGEITVRAIIPASASIELPLNDDGSIDASVTLPLVDPITKARVDLADVLLPGRDFIGWVEDDVIVEAGPIWADPFKFPHSERIIANGLWSYFDHRYVLPATMALGVLPRDVTTRYTGLSLGTIAKRLVQQANDHAYAGLPIDFLPDVMGDHEREYPGSDLKTVGDALRDLTALENGIDITFRPKWGVDRRHVRWDFLTGDPELAQSGDDHYWDVSVPNAHARVLDLDRDGTELSSREFTVGTTLRNLFTTDPSFESGFTAVELGSGSTGFVWYGNGGAHGSHHFAWASTVGSGYAAVNIKQTIQIEEGEPLTFSFWGHTSTAGRPMRGMIRFYDEGGVQIGGDVEGPLTPVALADGYTRVDTVTVAPERANTAKCFILAYPSASGQGFGADAIMALKTTEIHPFVVEQLVLQHIAWDNSLVNAGFPLLESSTNRSSVVLVDTLRAYGNETVARGSAHIQTFTIVARRDKFPTLGTYWPGDYAKVRIGPNARIAAGTYRVRIVTITFERNGDVTIMCAPERVASGYPVPSTKRSWLRDKLRDLNKRIAETTRGT